MVMLSVLGFCRIVIALVFSITFLSKVFHLSSFERTITAFALLPGRFSRSLAVLFLVGEVLIVLLVVLGGPFLIPGFILASCLLLLFSAALASVLVRKVETSCGCFGPTERPISVSDVRRNAGLICCALLGCGLAAVNWGPADPGVGKWVLPGLGAIIFVALWLHLEEITRLFRQG